MKAIGLGRPTRGRAGCHGVTMATDSMRAIGKGSTAAWITITAGTTTATGTAIGIMTAAAVTPMAGKDGSTTATTAIGTITIAVTTANRRQPPNRAGPMCARLLFSPGRAECHTQNSH